MLQRRLRIGLRKFSGQIPQQAEQAFRLIAGCAVENSGPLRIGRLIRGNALQEQMVELHKQPARQLMLLMAFNLRAKLLQRRLVQRPGTAGIGGLPGLGKGFPYRKAFLQPAPQLNQQLRAVVFKAPQDFQLPA